MLPVLWIQFEWRHEIHDTGDGSALVYSPHSSKRPSTSSATMAASSTVPDGSCILTLDELIEHEHLTSIVHVDNKARRMCCVCHGLLQTHARVVKASFGTYATAPSPVYNAFGSTVPTDPWASESFKSGGTGAPRRLPEPGRPVNPAFTTDAFGRPFRAAC